MRVVPATPPTNPASPAGPQPCLPFKLDNLERKERGGDKMTEAHILDEEDSPTAVNSVGPPAGQVQPVNLIGHLGLPQPLRLSAHRGVGVGGGRGAYGEPPTPAPPRGGDGGGGPDGPPGSLARVPGPSVFPSAEPGVSGDPKKGNAKECSNYHTIALISHAGKVMLKKPLRGGSRAGERAHNLHCLLHKCLFFVSP